MCAPSKSYFYLSELFIYVEDVTSETLIYTCITQTMIPTHKCILNGANIILLPLLLTTHVYTTFDYCNVVTVALLPLSLDL